MTVRRPIPGFPGYAATSAGSVLGPDGRRRRGTAHHGGHLRVELDRGRRAFVHWLVALAFHGPCPRGCTLVRHLDGNPRNNRPDNLRWGTPAENARDREQHRTR